MRGKYRVCALAVLVVLSLALSACDTFTNSQQVGDLETNVAQLKGTIDVMGTPAATAAALQMTADRAMVLQAELNGIQSTTIALQSTLTTLQIGGASSRVTPVPSGANAASGTDGTAGANAADPAGADPAAAPAPNASGTTFVGTTTSLAVRQEDGCAQQPSAVFDADTQQIYVVTTANNLSAGSVLGARWFNAGALYADEPECWIPNDDWQQVCSWCALSAQGGAFPSGNWTVELTLDGQLMSQSSFQVMGEAPVSQVTAEPAS